MKKKEKKRQTGIVFSAKKSLAVKGTRAFRHHNINFTLFHGRAAAAAVAAQTSTGKCCAYKTPPPLLRSRTLPAIIVPGISILQTQLNPSRQPIGGMYSHNLYVHQFYLYCLFSTGMFIILCCLYNTCDEVIHLQLAAFTPPNVCV